MMNELLNKDVLETTTTSEEEIENDTTTSSEELIENETTTSSEELIENDTTTSEELIENDTTTSSEELIENDTTTTSEEEIIISCNCLENIAILNNIYDVQCYILIILLFLLFKNWISDIISKIITYGKD